MKSWALKWARYDQERAADLVQDACLDALGLAYDPEKAGEITVLYRIMRNRYLKNIYLASMQKRQAKTAALEDLMNEARVDQRLQMPPRQDEIVYACEIVALGRKLTPGQQRALGKAIAGTDERSERTLLWQARQALGRKSWETMRRGNGSTQRENVA